MKQFFKFAAVLASVCLISCEKGSSVLFTNANFFGEVQGSTIIVNGNGKYNVTEDETDGGWRKNSRNFFQGDILSKSEDNGYEIRVKGYTKVSINEVLTKGEADPESYGNDAVCFFEDWGINPDTGLFDLSYLITFKTSSETEHSVSLVYDPVRSHLDTIVLELHHNAFGESFDNKEIETSNLATGVGYTSFNLKPLISTISGDTAVISLEWDWFKNDGESMSRETEHSQATGTIRIK